MAMEGKMRLTKNPGRHNISNPKTITRKTDMEIIYICSKACDLIDSKKIGRAHV